MMMMRRRRSKEKEKSSEIHISFIVLKLNGSFIRLAYLTY